MKRAVAALLALGLILPLHAGSLANDDRIGKIVDSQGIASIKPRLHRRWTLVADNFLLKPGDWLRTDVRGANALRAKLANQTRLILGPGTLVEAVDAQTVKLVRGELEVSVPGKEQVQLLAPGNKKLVVTETQVFRVRRNRLEELDREPDWLQGFKGTVTTESMGALLANVEGRNVPLTVGYHKVTVDIRDQLARTVVEESFVNHTGGVLEGVFHFPLPQDASISGFAMWIGDRCVEADVVEKQRAREIYETILREKRDPGLLEWTGGNIFKARVYPIFAHSEKRIKITYTQVLPLRGGRCRYSYALQSELLKQHPLRELAIDVRVHSALPLKEIVCKTHEVRTDKTAHAGHVEFSAQEYTPDRDFEVEIEVDHRNSPVVLIPHQRGEDGYFLLLLTPPEASGEWQREVLPDGDPLELLILADTSGSMDAANRKAQDGFLAAVLSSLGQKDTFNLAACDVTCDWFAEKPIAANEENVASAREFLASRRSLGWTDLDRAFASALERTKPKARVIYVGDGVTTTKDADPVAFAKRLKLLCEGKPGTFHAVATGSSCESVVLRAIASTGGGSLRGIAGQDGPRAAAYQLLSEISQPTLRDLKIEFRGLRTARVYPSDLPNLPAGFQQIVLGRYLPEGRDQSGEVIVTGVQNGKPVRFRAPASLKDAEKGNSFIPRLWARLHLDALLEQGRSQAIKDEIIALSEEYNIITPYTSLLVLESDADRERFKVKRRFRMRDGQKFFAEGRDTASYELVQQQMKRAGNWRLGLRRHVLRQFAQLGRDPRLIPRAPSQPAFRHWPCAEAVDGIGVDTFCLDAGFWGNGLFEDLSVFNGAVSPSSVPLGVICYREGAANGVFDPPDEMIELPPDAEGEPAAFLRTYDASDIILSPPDFGMLGGPDRPWVDGDFGALLDFTDPFALEPLYPSDYPEVCAGIYPWSWHSDSRARPWSARHAARMVATGGDRALLKAWTTGKPHTVPARPFENAAWLSAVFPNLPQPPPPPAPLKRPWPAPAHQLSESLLRKGRIAAHAGGVEVRCTRESHNVRWKRVSGVTTELALLSKDAWLTRKREDWQQTLVHWCNRDERGVLSPLFQLGRRREAASGDRRAYHLSLFDWPLSSLERSYHTYIPTLEPRGADRTLLKLTASDSEASQVHVLIDTRRHVILRIENRWQEKVSSLTALSGFVRAGGCWWPTRVAKKDGKGRTTELSTYEVRELTPDAFAPRLASELALRKSTIVIQQPLPTLVEAKQAVMDTQPTLEAHLVLLAHFGRSQQWDRADEHLKQSETLARGRPGVRWLRDAALRRSRRHEDLKQRVLEVAREAAKEPRTDDLYLANDHLVSQARGIFQHNEMLSLLEIVKPIYERQPPRTLAVKRWRERYIDYLRHSGQADRAFALEASLAKDFPAYYTLQQGYANRLAKRGEYAAAYTWLDDLLAKRDFWLSHEKDALRGTYADLLLGQGRYSEMVAYLEKWVAADPTDSKAYARYLSALVRMGRAKEAHALIERWLKDGQREGRLEPAVLSRLQAATEHVVGRGHHVPLDWSDGRWHEPIAQVVRYFALHKTHAYVADRLMRRQQLRGTDVFRALRAEFAQVLLERVAELDPMQIRRLVGWVWPGEQVPTREAWQKIAKGLEQRWSVEKKPGPRHWLGQIVVRILTSYAEPPSRLAFLLRQWREGPQNHRATYAKQLLHTLLDQPWSREHEDLAFGLLGEISDDTDRDRGLALQVRALYRLVGRMVAARHDAAMAAEPTEKLSEDALAALREEKLREVRTAFARRLAEEAPKQEAPRRPWLAIERLYLLMLAGRDAKEIAAECWEYLGDGPAAEPEPMKWLEALLLLRHLRILEYLATGPQADAELGKRLLTCYEKGIADHPASPAWKLAKYRLLLALDRPGEMEKALRSWIRPGKADSTWRLLLGYLLAETNRIPEAIQQFETIEASDELGPGEYRVLADWYLVEDERDKHQRALVGTYKTQDDQRLRQQLDRLFKPWQRERGQVPRELDPEVVRILTALFRKASYPGGHLPQLTRFYKHSRDFRLLECLAQSVVGHTASGVYFFLQQLGGVLNEIHDEATADSLLARLAVVRKRAKSPVDHRALDLLAMQVERRAAELANQPGPHTARALEAMQRAFKGQWSRGERRLMADLLAHLGRITQTTLAKEQLRQIEILHRDEQKGSYQRLCIAERWAALLCDYENGAKAIDVLAAALDEYREASGGKLPQTAQNALDAFVGYLESREQYVRGERALLAELGRVRNRQLEAWLSVRLHQLYRAALSAEAETSLGSGQQLYKAVERKLLADLDAARRRRWRLVKDLCALYRTAATQKLAGAADGLKAFARRRVPEVLQPQADSYQHIVSTAASALHEVIGPREGLAFLIERIEKEPVWLRPSGWSAHAAKLAAWRLEAKDLGALEPRLLKIVTGGLRRALGSRTHEMRYVFHQHGKHFWREKAGGFAWVAEDVLKERRNSRSAVKHISRYLYEGLGRHGRAITALHAAHEREILDEDGRSLLVRYLHEQSRHAESIPVAKALVARHPDRLDYRGNLMQAYFRTGKKDLLVALLEETDAYFHGKDGWSEIVIAKLADSCLRTQLYDRAAAYYEELLALHQDFRLPGADGDATLSGYYRALAQAYTALGHTAKAVEAACATIVSCGRKHQNRRKALECLKKALMGAADLDGYVASLNEQVGETGLENPIVRKALGQVYLEKGEHAKAIAQLRLAAAVQPNDTEIQEALVAAYDKQGDKEEAIRQLLEWAALSRRDLSLYKNLAERYTAMAKLGEAERAYTTVVEMQPTESESHTLLAEIRQRQGRWPEAIVHWQQVARIRALEPTGLEKLAQAQIHEKRWGEARESIEALLRRAWPERFAGVHARARTMLRQVEASEK